MIEVKNVVKKYGKVEVLKNISFNINKGEIVGLVGNNGVGKSTVMKSIMTFIKINSGEILIDGKDIYKNREYLLENTSSVIEIAGFYPELTGYEHLKLIRDIRGVSEEAINELIEFIDIGKNLNKRTSTYSLGMKQRLAIAIAILSAKSVLILDEPTNGLDQKSILRLIKILKKCKEKGMCILISSHTLAYLEEVCDRFLFMDKGVIVYSLDKKDISNNKYIIILKEEFIPSKLNFSCYIEIKDKSIIVNEDSISKIINLLMKHNIEISSIEKTNRDLKSFYMEYIEGEIACGK